MVRTPSFDKNGIKKGAWSPEEDRKLEGYITRYGHWNWRELPKFAGLKRCGKSCRLRWMNYLRPNVRRGNYTKDEEDLIMELHKKHGNKWAMIAGRLPGRTDNEIKNHWHTHLKKRWRNLPSDKSHVSLSSTDSMTSESERSVQLGRASSRVASSLMSANPAAAAEECFRHIKILESCPLSPPPPPPPLSSAAAGVSISSSDSVGRGIFDDIMSDCFFAGPEFTPLGDLSFDPPATSCSSMNSAGELAAGSTAHGIRYDDGLEGDGDFWTKPFSLEDMMSSYDAGCSFIHDYSTAENHHLLLSPDVTHHHYQGMADLFSHQDQIMP